MLEIGMPASVVPLTPKKSTKPARATAPEVEGTSAKVLDAEPSPLEGIIEPLELVKIEPKDVQALFTTDGALKPILEKVATLARSVIQDATTAKGREAIKSLAYKIAQAKTALEAQGVALNRELKALPAAVDKNKREAKEFLEALQAEIRKPVTEWEAEQARIEAEKKAAEAAAELARQIEADHEIALTLNWAYDQKKREEMEALEKAVLEREKEIAREAAEKSAMETKEALERAEREKAEAEQRQRDAEAREAQAKIDAEAARVKAEKEAEERAEQAAIEARQKEQERQAAEKKAEDDARAARERDIEHRRALNRDAWCDVQAVLLAQPDPHNAESIATEIVKAIASGKIRHISITY